MRVIRRISATGLLALITLFEASAFLLLAFASGGFDVGAVYVGGVSILLMLAQYLLLTALYEHVDRYLLIITNFLSALGLIVQYRLNYETAYRQLMMIVLGMVAMHMVIALMKNVYIYKKPVYLYMIGGLALLTLSLLFGREVGGAKNWFNVLGFSVQPSELVKVVLVFVLAAVLSEKTRLMQLWPLVAFVAAALGLLVLQKDLGAALLYAGTAIIVYYVATGNLALTGAALGVAGVGAVASYHMFSHVRVRVEVWRDPWALYDSQGYQIAQGLMAIASGGLFGMGLACGSPKSIPAYRTDYIFAVICEEFGLIVGLCVIALYLVFIMRGAHIAMNSSDRFSSLLAIGCTALISLQSFIIIGGVIKLIPLTGITLPFVSYGGSSMLACMMLSGVLQAVAIKNGKEQEEALDEQYEA